MYDRIDISKSEHNQCSYKVDYVTERKYLQ